LLFGDLASEGGVVQITVRDGELEILQEEAVA
jgi:hypothetical protein